MVLCFLLALLLALDSESRHVFPYFPLLVAFAVKGIHDVGWTSGSLLGFAALSALIDGDLGSGAEVSDRPAFAIDGEFLGREIRIWVDQASFWP
jgi:hypothetical protein